MLNVRAAMDPEDEDLARACSGEKSPGTGCFLHDDGELNLIVTDKISTFAESSAEISVSDALFDAHRVAAECAEMT